MSPRKKVNRRQFLGAGLTGVTILGSSRLVRAYEANERLHLAMFGTMYNAAHMLSAPHLYNAPIVACCDPDERNIQKAKQHWRRAATRLAAARTPQQRQWAERYQRMAEGVDVKFYSDIRRMYDKEADSIDACVISHYDHLHGVACGPALRTGKPVLSERPLGLNISDARSLRHLATKTQLPTTYRSPGTGHGAFRRAMELVDDGLLGAVREVHIWFKRGGPDRDALPQGHKPVPAALNWDAWLGPLPWRPYHPEWMAYAHWRETCSGGLGTFGPHTAIFPFMTLGLRRLWDQGKGQAIIEATAQCSRLNRISFPRWERIRWKLPARGSMPPVQITWHHGPEFAPGTREMIQQKLSEFGIATTAEIDELMKNAGSVLLGSDGALVADDHSVRVTGLPRAKFADIEMERPQRIPAGRNIYRDWIDACRGQPSHIIASFDNGGPLSELLMLGNIATRFPEEPLSYDPALGRIRNHSDANEYLGLEYRHGWTL